MKIAFVGGGAIAKAIAHLAMEAGHDIVLGVRSPDKDDATPFRRATIEAAVTGADLVLLAIPYGAAQEVLPSLAKHLAGSIVVDAINPVADDWSPIPTGEDSSAAERIQSLLPGSKVVKGFNTIFADVVRPDRLDRSGHKVTLFVAGDDSDAKARVMALGSEIGFSPLDAGPLKSARYLEGIAHLNIELAVGQGGGTDAAFVYHRAA